MKTKNFPAGWFPASEAESKRLYSELQKELPPDHLLFGRNVEVIAHRDGATDDILVRHVGEPERYTVIHLTWSSRQEGDATHPSVEADGSWEDFLAYEKEFE